MRIWITDAEFQHTLGIVRELGKNKNYDVTVIGRFDFAMSRFSIYCKSFVKRPRNISLTDFLLKNFDEFDFLIGVGATSIEAISNSDKLRGKSFVPIPEQMSLALSKEATYKFCNSINIPAPESIYPSSTSLDSLKINELKYPLVIKAKFEMGGNVVQYANSYSELETKYKEIVKNYNFSNNDLPLIQEYITGEGCAYFAFYENGVLVDDFMHKRLMEYPLSGGHSVKAKSYKNDKLKEYGKTVLDKLKWNGVAMVEFKEVSQDEYVIMEINPKYWGSTELALASGANFPTQMVRTFMKEDIVIKDKSQETYIWPLKGYISNLIAKPSLIISFIKDIFDPSVQNNFIHKDVMGSFGILINLLGDTAVKIVKKIIR
jgi:predicted ATP-grasp superfamily ATP-dependent carboligase